ncbi:hypothetical protein EVAR_87841_1 [Eumeta japonica]|uniref:Uncharacterized protein n=1 Tax=Eumeta variegata TaxID=151549 RepID=A0A4C1YCZ6_EUMVA|nr:hypothetical protein EVAR_87841_1 [Eumeta japonica]
MAISELTSFTQGAGRRCKRVIAKKDYRDDSETRIVRSCARRSRRLCAVNYRARAAPAPRGVLVTIFEQISGAPSPPVPTVLICIIITVQSSRGTAPPPAGSRGGRCIVVSRPARGRKKLQIVQATKRHVATPPPTPIFSETISSAPPPVTAASTRARSREGNAPARDPIAIATATAT